MSRTAITVALIAWLASAGVQVASPQQDQTAALLAKAQTVVDLMAAGDFSKAEDLFDAVMKGALGEDKLKAAWSAVVQQAGAFKSRVRVSGQPRGVLLITRVTCQFEKMNLDVQVVFDKDGLVGGLSFAPVAETWNPPSYATPGSFAESDLTVGADHWPLPGTLTLPAGAGPFPAVVLVHGSGPEDRDESYGPNKTFKDLAVGLAARGVAVLRYEKRTQQYAGKLAGIANFTVKDETIDDAVAAVAVLRRQPRIDPARVFVAGHSLGGTLLPRIAVADPAIAGLISLAGGTRKLADVLIAQITYLVSASGSITPEGQKQIDDTKALVARIQALTPADANNPQPIGGAPAAYWLDLNGYDPVAAARAIPQPMLLLQGERDYQVTMAEDFSGWKNGLAGRPRVTFHTYPALNHLFLPGTGKSLPAEYNTAGHVPDDVIRDIAEWIAAQPRGR